MIVDLGVRHAHKHLKENIMKRLLIVVPCYNEEEVLPDTIKKLKNLLKRMIKQQLINDSSQICFVDDGSIDNTWTIIEKECHSSKQIEGIKLSRNFGHQSAILAGMLDNNADWYVTIDADLQDNPECIIEMIKKAQNGCEIVYGVRKERTSDSWFKRVTAQMFYKLMALLGVNIIYNHADFRLMSKRVVNELKKFPERNLFLRAVVPLIGFKSDKVFYDRTPRLAGTTKYPLKKMLAFAWNGISSFSIVPLRMVTCLGFLISFIGALFVLKIFLNYNEHGAVSGWASTVTLITVFSGVQLISLGIIGEYIAKIFVEVKQRPLYLIEKEINK